MRKGVRLLPRDAPHRITAYKSEELSISMNETLFEQLQSIDSRFSEDFLGTFDDETSVELRSAKAAGAVPESESWSRP
ncbi:hypothetical protein ARSEF4850_003180 [Beauveria asiatica]